LAKHLDEWRRIGGGTQLKNIAGVFEPFALFPRLITRGRCVMADRAGLGFLGCIFGGVTAFVMLVAVTVVIGHVDGRLALDASPQTYVAASQ
jgi:hypothetical protein